MTISRRVFAKSGGLALFSLGLDPLFLARAALASYRPRPPLTACYRPVLVCLFQRGAVDGLNMIVPHGDSLYYRERTPRRASLNPLWDNGSLPAIQPIGPPASTRSHFDAQDYMETATPGRKAT